MVNGKKLVVSASPHIRSTQTTTRIMLDVIISLIPALIAAMFIFGPRVLCVAAVSISSAVLAEYVSRKVMKRHQTIGDLSAIVTGLILALNLPSTIPYWIAAIGSVVAIVVVKQFFGGIGQNFANPAITARIVLLLSFGAQMVTGQRPFHGNRKSQRLQLLLPLVTALTVRLLSLICSSVFEEDVSAKPAPSLLFSAAFTSWQERLSPLQFP